MVTKKKHPRARNTYTVEMSKGTSLVVLYPSGKVSLVLPGGEDRMKVTSTAVRATVLALVGRGMGPFASILAQATRVFDTEMKRLEKKGKKAA